MFKSCDVLGCFAIFLCLSFSNPLLAQAALDGPDTHFPVPQINFAPRHYICYRSGSPLVIDGKLTESAWQKTDWSETFVDIRGDTFPKPWFQTRMKMLWDTTFLYIAANLEEAHIWAQLTQRDTVIFYDNDFEVFIDPDGDTHQYYELEINAFGTVWDLFLDKPYRDDCRPLFFWDIGGLKKAVHIDGTLNTPGDRDNGWTVELALPWDVLKECANRAIPPNQGDQWRMNFSRVQWHTDVKNGRTVKQINPDSGKPKPEENWVWSPQGLIAMHYPEMWGFVQFSEIVAGRGTDSYVPGSEETIKWALRQVYYAQKRFQLANKVFTDCYEDLHVEIISVDGFSWPPAIRCTKVFYEVCSTAENGTVTWCVSHDGRIWKETKSVSK